jgi:hypothetical protein
MLVCAIGGGADLVVNSITGHTGGAAWVQIADVPNWSTTNRDFKLWACFVGASPSSETVTIDINYADLSMAALYEFVGVDTSGSVANAFGVNGQEAGYNTSPWTATLSAFSAPTNMTFAVAIQVDTTPTFTWSDGTFTTGTTRFQGTWAMQPAWLDAEDNSVVLVTENSKNCILWATEIKATGGSSTPVPLFTQHRLRR